MRSLHKTATIVASAVVFAMVLPSQAAVVDLGLGWQASWDSSLDGYVDVNASDVNGVLFIQKYIDFREPPVNGVIPAVVVQFQQTSSPAAESFVIDDEILINHTGVTWSDFHMELVDSTGGTVFDPVKTGGGTGPIGWTIDPFTIAVFSSDLTKLDIWEGMIAPNATWYPGDGVSDGQLWIDVTPKADNSAAFTLVEIPTTTGIPEPATLCLLALGGLLVIRRRR